jgi:rod shape-determining protein MreB and related proteins
MYGIVASETLRMGGIQLDEAIVSYVGKNTALSSGSSPPNRSRSPSVQPCTQDEEHSVELQGQDQVTGLPRPVTLTTGEVVEAMQDRLQRYRRCCPPGAGKNTPRAGI